MEAVGVSETSLHVCQITRRNIQDTVLSVKPQTMQKGLQISWNSETSYSTNYYTKVKIVPHLKKNTICLQ